MDPTFEELRAQISALVPPAEASARQVYWVREPKLGIAIDPRGAFEIFLVGNRLAPRSPLVARHLEFDAWLSATGDSFIANRLVFPPAPHFLGFSTLVAIELLQAGWCRPEVANQAAFEAVEALIEMALRKASLSEEALLGLIGELLTLEQLLTAVATTRPELRSAVLDLWRGYQRSSRDFVLGASAIEVKTTMRPTSEHYIHGLSQIQPSNDDEHALYLLSVSLSPADAGFSLPDLVDRLLVLLREEETSAGPLQLRLLRDIAQYGGDAGLGYVHTLMSTWPVYQQEYLLTFAPRLFDMLDPEVRVVRRADLVGTFVNPERIEYQVRLPARVNSVNPQDDWQGALASLVRASFDIEV